MAQAAATRAVIGVDSANRRQLLFSATDREFLIARKSDCTDRKSTRLNSSHQI